MGVVLVVALALAGGWLLHDVSAMRRAVEGRVRALIVLQELDQRQHHDEPATEEELKGLLADVRGHVAPLEDPELDVALDTLATQLVTRPVDASTRDLVRLLRRQNGVISARLGARWSWLNGLVLFTLGLAGALLWSMRLAWKRQLESDALRRELEASARAAEEARADAQRANEEKTRFLARLSHDLRSPMTGILGMSELLGETELDADQAEYVDVIVRSSHFLGQMVSQLLELSRLELGGRELKRDPLDPIAVCEEAMLLVAPLAQARGLRMLLRIDVDPVPGVLGDPLALQQILVNLLGNAAKFTEEGRVFVTIGCDGGATELRVEDEGPGVRDDQLDAIFEPYVRSGRADGFGLGLAIVARLVAAMGGSVRVENRDEGGARFVIRLPSSEAPRSGPETLGGLRGRRVGLLDPVEEHHALLARALRGQGATVAWAGSAEGAQGLPDDLDIVILGEGVPLALADRWPGTVRAVLAPLADTTQRGASVIRLPLRPSQLPERLAGLLTEASPAGARVPGGEIRVR